MRAVTIWQPWATLILCGIKLYETRSWPTDYRGPLVITAAKRWEDDQAQLLEPIAQMIETHRPAFLHDMSRAQKELWFASIEDTLGRALGVVNLTDCKRMQCSGDQLENYLGNFGPGRFGWKCETPTAFDSPLQCTGKQGLWIPSERLAEQARQLISEAESKT